MQTIIRLKHLCNTREDEIRRRLELSPAEYHCLNVIPTEARVGAGALARMMGLSASRFSRVMARMERGGLLRRHSGNGDGRTVEVELSDRGRLIQAEVRRTLDECEGHLLAGLPEDDVDTIKASLEQLADVMSDLVVEWE